MLLYERKLKTLDVESLEILLKKLTKTQLCTVCKDLGIPFSYSNRKDMLIAKILKNMFKESIITIPKHRGNPVFLELVCVDITDRDKNNHRKYKYVFIDKRNNRYEWYTYKELPIRNKVLGVKATLSINKGKRVLSRVLILKEIEK